ncbi:polymeric immunoglobulin receptor-like isoform X2 [Pristis pectinata]|uniref:polymeric immunoglobulin receptor-like isoform X2 n=1 Tax=Pristis pectinata TaxID=685728 RepID=UPI00223DCC7B|nr:polymeric immunoglobulin receptor-like isoform X2 [Pristis pectinata]
MWFSALLLLSVISSSLAQAPTTVIRAGVGETVTMECPHTPKRKHIGWCRANSSEKCIIVVDTLKYNDNGRTSIRRLNESVFVTTSQLKKSDSGTYWCGHYKENSIIISDIVMLEVFTDSWTPNKTTVNGMMGNSTTLHCQYEEQFKSYKKFLCKVTSVNRCSIIASSEQSNSRKLSISINNYSNFAVTMKQTDEVDEGEYWCGATITVDFEIVQVKILEFYKATTRRPKVPTNIGRNNTPQIWHIVLPLVLGLLVLLLIVLLIKRMKRIKPITPENNNKIPETPATTKIEKETEDTITYSTVTIQPSTQAEESPVIYSNLKDMKEQNGDIKIHSSESVEYSTLMFSS